MANFRFHACLAASLLLGACGDEVRVNGGGGDVGGGDPTSDDGTTSPPPPRNDGGGGSGGDPCAMSVDGLAEKIETVLDAEGVSGLTVDAPAAIVARQACELDGDVPFEAALAAALDSFLTVDDYELETPLSLIVVANDEGLLPAEPCLQPEPGDQLRCYLVQPDARIALVSEIPAENQARDVFPPENGEDPAIHYAFYLEGVFGHAFWAIVPRSYGPNGELDTYNYGFN